MTVLEQLRATLVKQLDVVERACGHRPDMLVLGPEWGNRLQTETTLVPDLVWVESIGTMAWRWVVMEGCVLVSSATREAWYTWEE